MKQSAAPELPELSPEELDQLVLSEYPYPIAVNYRKMLQTKDWDRRTRQCIEVFEYGLRAMTLGVLSEYLIRDANEVRDPELDRKLLQRLSKASLGQWTEFFFLVLRAYGGRRDLFFVPDLYDLYWDTSHEPHRLRKGLRGPFERLGKIRNDLAHGLPPNTDAGWETLGTEALDLLRKVLGHFSFLQHYDLIRIVAQQGGEYEYERYTGQEITGHCEPLQGNGGLHEGWFYLRRDDKAVLNLHPLFVLWPDGPQMLSDDAPRDAAVFERLLNETVEYVATVVREMVKSADVELLAQFRELIYYNLEHIKLGQTQTPLSWDSLRQAAGKLTQDKTGAIQVRYQRALYLQRDEAFRKFQDFLASDKACFVLTGNSGVGKSNFVLSLADELAQRDEVCLLIYNASRLEILETAAQTITQDLTQYLSLGRGAAQDFLAELDRYELMAGRQLIVVFDAVNENSDPRALLQKIDQLVGDKHYPWLKVLITSRPQSWWSMKHGLPLAEERYYQDHDSDTLWVELREFTVKLEPFKGEELRRVYERYRQNFDLKTPYNEIGHDLREALQDPLVLRLVAETYKGQPIPERIQVTEIYGKYIAALVESERLNRKDIILLEHELVPLMIFRGHYDKAATSAQINAARTNDGRHLWELIFSDDLLSNDERVNDSFHRLVDVGILLQPAKELDYSISFNYERFYEYFGGRRMRKLAAEPDVEAFGFYQQIADQLSTNLFLWGVLVQALTAELTDGRSDLLLGLAKQSRNNRLLHNALVEALVQGSKKDPQRTDQVLTLLASPLTPPPSGFLDAVNRLVRPPKDLEVAAPGQIIAAEAAARVGNVDLLIELASQPSASLRTTAVQNAFYTWKMLWREKGERNFEVLKRLSKRVTDRYGLPDLAVAESMLVLTGAVLGEEHEDSETLQNLLDTGRNALRQVLQLGDRSQRKGIGRVVPIGLIYRLLINTILGMVLRVIKGYPDMAWLTVEGMRHVFTLTSDQKQKLRSLIPYLDTDIPGYQDRVADFIEVYGWADQIGQAIIESPLISHGAKGADEFERTLDLVEKLNNVALSEAPPRFWAGGANWNIWQGAVRLKNPKPESLDRLLNEFERVNTAVQQDPQAWLNASKRDIPYELRSSTRATGLGAYIGAADTCASKTGSPLHVPESVVKWLEKAVADRDDEFLKCYIGFELLGLLQLGQYKAIVAGLKPIAHYKGKDDSVRNSVVDLLVSVRGHDPDYVDGLFLREEFSKEIAERVHALPTSEKPFDLIALQAASILYDLFITGPAPLREELQWFLVQFLQLPNLEEWIKIVIKELTNLITGEHVFDMPEDAPSRRYAGMSLSMETAHE